MNTNTTLRLAPSLVVQTLLQRKWPITSLTAVSSSPTLHCRLQGSLLFLNPLLAALLQGNIYPFPRCVPFSAALEISPHLHSVTMRFSRCFLLSVSCSFLSLFYWILFLLYCSHGFILIFPIYILFHGNFIPPNIVKFLPSYKCFPNLSNHDLSHKPQTISNNYYTSQQGVPVANQNPTPNSPLPGLSKRKSH